MSILWLLIVPLFLFLLIQSDSCMQKRRAQLQYIDDYVFHPAIKDKLKAKHPLLHEAQLDLVFWGLRDYFYICNEAQGRMVSMPSQAVDDAWHEFILFSRDYGEFCQNALGHFLHHTPAEAMRTPTAAQDGIKLAWGLACVKESIDPKKPGKLPLLFAVDSLVIEGGFIYRLDCTSLTSGNHEFCASDIGCGGGGGCGGGCGGCGGCGACGGCGG